MTGIQKLNRWTVGNGLLISFLVGCFLMQWITLIILAPAVLVSFIFLHWYLRSSWKNQYILGGPANMVTWVRLLLVILLLALAGKVSPWVLSLLAFTEFGLDGLDGRLAKIYRTQSVFGEYFDKEVDAFFVMVLSLLLYELEYTGWWVLSLGLIRYANLIPEWFLKPFEQKDARTSYGRIIAGMVMTGLCLAFILPTWFNGWFLPALAILLFYSFGRGFLESLRFHLASRN